MILDVFKDERGVTTTGMVVSLLLSLALVFTSAQVYRVSSASAAVREVADAAALAAENEVAEFMIAVRVCDAVVLSLSLLGVVVYGASVVAMCVPSGASVSAKLIDLGGKIVSARDGFAQRAASGLNALQKALPFICAAQAASVAKANDAGSRGSSYYAAALLVPSVGEEVALATEGRTGQLGGEIEAEADSIRDAAARAEEMAVQAQEAKLRGFESDCGKNPAYCLYERAGSLADLPPEQNPRYESVDAWSFAVPLERARAYYAARYEREAPESDSVADQARSFLRKRFYAYASEELAKGYVIDEADRFDASFPRLFSNIDEMRETKLYEESVYPVTEAEGGGLVMHAWPGCPGAAGYTETGSLRRLEEQGDEFRTCDRCGFTLSSMGNIAAASTSIDNGFEHHYGAIAQAAEDYEKARAQLDPVSSEVKDLAGGLMEECADIAKSFGSSRIDANPPGRYGVVALVVDVGQVRADAGFSSSFVQGGQTLGARAAVAGATMMPDESEDSSSILSSLLDGFGSDAGAAVGAARIVLGCWSALLRAFSDGQEALGEAVRSALDQLPLASSSGLGSWAADLMRDVMEGVGLQPAELNVLKPVLVNTGHVAALGEDSFSVSFSEAKARALSVSSSSTDLFTALVDGVEEEAFSLVEKLEGGVVVARIEFPVGDLSIPITLALPSGVADAAGGFLDECFAAVRSLAGSVTGMRTWS